MRLYKEGSGENVSAKSEKLKSLKIWRLENLSLYDMTATCIYLSINIIIIPAHVYIPCMIQIVMRRWGS